MEKESESGTDIRRLLPSFSSPALMSHLSPPSISLFPPSSSSHASNISHGRMARSPFPLHPPFPSTTHNFLLHQLKPNPSAAAVAAPQQPPRRKWRGTKEEGGGKDLSIYRWGFGAVVACAHTHHTRQPEEGRFPPSFHRERLHLCRRFPISEGKECRTNVFGLFLARKIGRHARPGSPIIGHTTTCSHASELLSCLASIGRPPPGKKIKRVASDNSFLAQSGLGPVRPPPYFPKGTSQGAYSWRRPLPLPSPGCPSQCSPFLGHSKQSSFSFSDKNEGTVSLFISHVEEKG